jgi:hypothetical protein
MNFIRARNLFLDRTLPLRRISEAIPISLQFNKEPTSFRTESSEQPRPWPLNYRKGGEIPLAPHRGMFATEGPKRFERNP